MLCGRPHTGALFMNDTLSLAHNFMENNREKTVIRTSVISIVANIILAVFKAVIGFLANSIAIISDAVNNLSDALSSIITIVGTKLAGKAPEKNILTVMAE